MLKQKLQHIDSIPSAAITAHKNQNHSKVSRRHPRQVDISPIIAAYMSTALPISFLLDFGSDLDKQVHPLKLFVPCV